MFDPTLSINLLRIAHATNAPEDQGADWEFDVILPSVDGWMVALFYDCGELDYLDHFISPLGERIDVWESDSRFVRFGPDDGEFGFSPLQCWRGLSDTERLIALIEAAQ